MKVAVAGASGLIGSALVRALRDRGDTVTRLVRRPARGPEERSWDPGGAGLEPALLSGLDAVVNLGGAGLGDRRWTASYRRTVRDSRVVPTHLLARTLAQLDDGPGILVQASAVGFYGDRPGVVLDESASPGAGFVPQLVQDWEAAATPAVSSGVRVAWARTGIVLAPQGGALSRLTPLARLGIAGRLGPGTQDWAWITLRDEVRALLHLLDEPVHGPVNLTSPRPVPNADLVRALARAHGRSAPLAVPAWALRLGLGGFAGELLAAQHVVPAVLESDGFQFEDPDIASAMAYVVTPRGDAAAR